MKISSVYRNQYVNRYIEQPKQYKKPQAPVYASEKSMYDTWHTLTAIQVQMINTWKKATSKRDKKRLANYLRKEFNVDVREVA